MGARVSANGDTAAVTVEVVQKPFELAQLVTLVRAAEPSRILEIGVWDGGTLREWVALADDVTAIDDQCRHPGLWKEWAIRNLAELHLFRTSSHNEDAIREIASLGPYDFVFIDADHSYEGVRADWENYSPMVADGGMVAFHDIVERPDYGVSRLWAEIKAAGGRWVEIVDTSEPFGGIGVVWP